MTTKTIAYVLRMPCTNIQVNILLIQAMKDLLIPID